MRIMGISEKSILRTFILLQRLFRDTLRDLAALAREKSLACKTCMMMSLSYRFKISSSDMGARLASSGRRDAERDRTSPRPCMPSRAVIDDSTPAYPIDPPLQNQFIFQHCQIFNLVMMRSNSGDELPQTSFP